MAATPTWEDTVEELPPTWKDTEPEAAPTWEDTVEDAPVETIDPSWISGPAPQSSVIAPPPLMPIASGDPKEQAAALWDTTKQIAGLPFEAAALPGKIAYAAAADAQAFTDQARRDIQIKRGELPDPVPDYGGNLKAMFTGNDSPAQKSIDESAKYSPKLAVAANLAKAAPELAAMVAVNPSGAAGRLLALGFSADMVANFKPMAERYAELVNLPPDEQDKYAGEIAQLRAGMMTTFGFAPLAGGHGAKIAEPVLPKAFSKPVLAASDFRTPAAPVETPVTPKFSRTVLPEQKANEITPTPQQQRAEMDTEGQPPARPEAAGETAKSPVPVEIEKAATDTGWTAGERQIGGIKLDTLPPETLAALKEKMPVQVEFTDRRAGSPSEGFTVYAPENAAAAEIKTLIEKKVADAVKPDEIPATPEPAPEVGAVKTLSDAETKTGEIVGMGGATPSEFEPQRGTATGIKNAKVDEERAARGLEPIMQPSRLSNQTIWDRTMAKIDADPGWQDRLIEELQTKPRTTTPEETLALDHRYVDLQNSADKLSRELAQAYDDSLKFPERNTEVAELRARQEQAAQQLDAFENLVKRAGTEWGRSGQIRQRLLNEDFSLAAMEAKRRAAKGGKPLTDTERAELVKLADAYKAKAEQLEKFSKEKDERIAQMEVESALKRIEKEATSSPEYHPKIIQLAEKIVAGLDRRADAARERIKERGFRFNTGLDPTVLRDVAEIGAAHLGHKVLDLAKWSERMISEFGEGIKPYLSEIFSASNKIIDDLKVEPAVKRAVKGTDTGEKIENAKAVIKERIDNGERNEISGQVQRIARLLTQRGIREREALIDATHEIVREIDPSFTRRETMDAISGYGDFRQLSKDEVSIALRGMKGEMQQIAKLEDMAAGIPPSKTGMERRTPTEKERALIKAVNEAKIKFQVPITDPATQLKSALDTRKAILKTRMQDYERRMKEGDFSKKPRRKLELDKEAERLTYDLFQVQKRFHEMLMQDRLANRSTFQKILGSAGEVANTARAIKTSFDLSAVLRQGGFIGLGHPIRALKSFPAMFKALRSEQGQHAVNLEIMKRKHYPDYVASKLYLSEHGQKLSKMEEAYMSRWADKIPGVAASQRAYVTFLNKLRADSFDAMAESLSLDGNLTKVEADAIANYINVSTGRGNLGMRENALVGLNTVFFAPRYVASRFQLLAGHPLYRGTAATRKAIAKEYARFLIGIGVVYGLGQLAGGHVEDDPRSSDFGKIRMGNTRIDPLAGLQQGTVLTSRLISGETKTLGGKIVPLRGDKVPYGSGNSADVLARFTRSKLAPVPGTFVDMVSGKNVVGEKVTPTSALTGSVAPLSLFDIYEAMVEQGDEKGAAIALLALFGMGVQTYDPKKPKNK